jgi:hypothetical protein
MELAKHIRADALRLITSRNAEVKFKNQIWNGRDGAAPFAVYARNAETRLLNVDSADQSSTSQPPSTGDRIFADTTLEKTLEKMIARKRRMVESEWKNPEFQRIVVQSLVRKLGDNPSPLLIAQHLAECEFERYQPPGTKLIIVSDSAPERLRRERLRSLPI